jgi:hypothetical protein
LKDLQLLEGAAEKRKNSLGPPPKKTINTKPTTKRGVFGASDQNSDRNMRNAASDLKLMKSSPYFKEGVSTINLDGRLSSIMGGGTIVETGGNF